MVFRLPVKISQLMKDLLAQGCQAFTALHVYAVYVLLCGEERREPNKINKRSNGVCTVKSKSIIYCWDRGEKSELPAHGWETARDLVLQYRAAFSIISVG